MDSFQRLIPAILLSLAGFVISGCSAQRLVSREVLADPIMRFEAKSTVLAPNKPIESPRTIAPNDTVSIYTNAQGDPGSQVNGIWLSSGVHTSVELTSGLGIQAGYGMSYTKERLWRFDGYQGALAFQRLQHGPDIAVLYDDGTSLIQIGYGYRTSFDGEAHLPSISASTLVLGSDTKVEISYARKMRSLQLHTSDQTPVMTDLDERISSDVLCASIEQGFLPGINIRLDLQAILDNGYLENPYSLVTLWPHWPEEVTYTRAPVAYPESLPDSRTRFGAGIGLKIAVPGMAAALELGLSHGTGTWRVEHSSVHMGWVQRLGDMFSLGLSGGAYHQTRSLFYRDDYEQGPVGAYWTSDMSLSSFIAWWGKIALSMYLFPSRGRFMGMFKELNLSLSLRLLRADYNFEGLASQNGFTRYSLLGDPASREEFDGGWQPGAWFSMSAGF